MAVLYGGGLGGGYLAGNPINGTEKIGANFGLGGTLTKDTTIDASGKEFDFFQNIDGNLQTLHIGKALGGLLDFVGEHIEDSPNNFYLINGVADLSPFGENPYTAIVAAFDFTNNTQSHLKIDIDELNFKKQDNTGDVGVYVDIDSAEIYNNKVADDSTSAINATNTGAKMFAENNTDGTGSNIDANKDGSLLGSYTSHFIAEGVGTTDKKLWLFCIY